MKGKIETTRIIDFYKNLHPANDKEGYYFNDIMEWNDYKLEVTHDFIQWLFPDNTGGVNPNGPKLTKSDIDHFTKDPKLRENVIQATFRMLLFYGFALDKKNIVTQVNQLYRKEKGVTIGLFSTHNYRRITRIMKFLVNIKMEYISAIFFLSICRALKSDYNLVTKVLKNNSLKMWMSTQPFLVSYTHSYDVNKLMNRENINRESDQESEREQESGRGSSREQESEWESDWDDQSEWEEIPSSLLKDDENEDENKDENDSSEKGCNIKGLNYTGNSCYMDSALMCVFAIPNKTITDNILNKDLTKLKKLDRNLWSICNENIDIDIERRQNIQKVLNNITDSIRGKNNVENCQPLRRMLKMCPGSQDFHSTNTQDSGEFLTYLFNIFQVDVAKTSRRTYGSNDFRKDSNWVLVKEQNDNYSSPIVSVNVNNIEKDYDITRSIRQKQDNIFDESNIWTPDKEKPNITYFRRKEIFEIKESPIVIFNLTRTYAKMIFSKPKTKHEKEIGRGKFKGLREGNTWKSISASEEMVLKDKKLNLSAIVVHSGDEHYVAYFKCQGEWFLYDDVKHNIKNIGSYNKMILNKVYNPLTHGTIFFYT